MGEGVVEVEVGEGGDVKELGVDVGVVVEKVVGGFEWFCDLDVEGVGLKFGYVDSVEVGEFVGLGGGYVFGRNGEGGVV